MFFPPRKLHPYCRSERDTANKHTAQHREICSEQAALGTIKSLFAPNHGPFVSMYTSHVLVAFFLRERSGRHQPPAEWSPCTITYASYNALLLLCNSSLHHAARRTSLSTQYSSGKTRPPLGEMKSWLCGTLVGVVCCTRANARSIVVEHAFGPEAEFTHRGYMELVVDPSPSTAPTATLPYVALSDAHRIEDLIANDGLYLIRVSTDEESTNHIVAAISACQLRLSSFREEITLHVEEDGLVVGLDYKAPVGPLASTRDCTKMPVQESSHLFTKIKVVRAASAQSVPLQVVANSPPPGLMNMKENIASQGPKEAGNQSILVKYWYIFIPLVLSWMFTAGAPEQGPAAGANGPAGGTQVSGPGGAR